MNNICIKKENSFSALAFRILIILVWTQSTVLSFVTEIIGRMPFLHDISAYVFPTLIGAFALMACPLMFKFIKARDFLFYFVCVIIVLASIIIFPNNSLYIESEAINLLFAIAPMFFLGLSFSYETHKKDLYYASIAVVLSMFAYQFYVLYTGRELNADNMHAAYAVLPSILYLTESLFKKINIINIALLIMNVVMIFLFGTRGPMLIFTVFVAIRIIMVIWRLKSSILKFFISVLLIISIILLFSGDTLLKLAEYFSRLFGNLGFSTRIFDFFLSGELAQSSGREVLYDEVILSIKNNPVLGSGIMADRVLLSPSPNSIIYAHNLFLELWCHWGVFAGSFIAVLICGIPLIALKREKHAENFVFLLMFTLIVLIKLMLSSSYLSEPYLFFTLGVAISTIRKRAVFKPKGGESYVCKK